MPKKIKAGSMNGLGTSEPVQQDFKTADVVVTFYSEACVSCSSEA